MIEWIQKAEASDVVMLKKFAKTLTKFRSGILAYYDFDHLSSGFMEGMNNKIKTLNKIAYGYRDKEFLKLKMLSIHEARKMHLPDTERRQMRHEFGASEGGLQAWPHPISG